MPMKWLKINQLNSTISTHASALSALKLKPVSDLRLTVENKNGSSLDLLWHSAYFLYLIFYYLYLKTNIYQNNMYGYI